MEDVRVEAADAMLYPPKKADAPVLRSRMAEHPQTAASSQTLRDQSGCSLAVKDA